MKLSLILLAALTTSFVECVSMTADVDEVCSTKTLSFQGVSGVGEHTVSYTSGLDFSDVLKKMSNTGDVSLTTVSVSLSAADLRFIHHVKISVNGYDPPTVMLADTDVVADGSTLNVPITVDRSQLLNVLTPGRVWMTIAVSGTVPSQGMAVSNMMCVGIEAKADKSVSDLK